MRALKCRFSNIESIRNLGLRGLFDKSVKEYNLDTLSPTKLNRGSVKSQSVPNFNTHASHYVGMPEYKSKNIKEFHVVTFLTNKSSEELSIIFKQGITNSTKSIWFPKLKGCDTLKYRVVGGDLTNRYPIYVISKGRSKHCKTSDFLSQMEAKHFVVVEQDEIKDYKKNINDEFATLLALDNHFKETYDTFSNLGEEHGLGSGPARNFCWEHSISQGFKWHWIFDDNIIEGFFWLYQNNKIKVRTSTMFRAIEDFVDRYENLAISGMNYASFANTKTKMNPYTLNTKVYSLLLIRNDIPYRWRGRYNEDVDLCLRVLKGGLCTLQFNAFLGGKATTQKLKGGNTDTIYKDGTLEKSKMLQEMHPDVAKVVWRFGRDHHHVDYSGFTQRLIKKRGLPLFDDIDDYGMKIIPTKETSTQDTKSFLENKYGHLLVNYEKPTLNTYD